MAGELLLSRRDVCLGGACFCLMPRLVESADSVAVPSSVREVAPGIYIRQGVDEESTSTNGGAIANVGFIIGREAVGVADPGGSLADGANVREAIRSITRLPIRYVILSHVHPDHIFGAGAFAADKPVYVGHERLPGALAQRGEYYRGRLEQTLGQDAAGPIVNPTMLVKGRAEIDLGDRALSLTAHAIAHTDCDLSIFDQQTRTLLPADLLFVRRVPSLDGSITGWLKELAALKAMPAKQAVPGHGPAVVTWPDGAADLERYLEILLRETRQAVAKGLDINAAVQTVAQSERGRWALFEEYHGHNITQAFKELEWE
jgi:quinoprotein relay system zinc metallohydrolase 2